MLAGAGTTAYEVSQTFANAGELRAFTNYHGYTVGEVTDIDTIDTFVNMRMGWREKHGSGATELAMEDSLLHDGFLRVASARYRTDGATVATDSFTFDRDGGIRVVGGYDRTYDTLTMRMTAHSHTHTYDAAGNLTYNGNLALSFGYDGQNRLVSVRNGSALLP